MTETQTNIYLFCGVPGVGKDYIANKLFPENIILSYDQIRIEQFLKNNSNFKSKNSNDLYNAAWNWCNKSKIDLGSILRNKIIHYATAGHNISICNTNISVKPRKKLINEIIQITSKINLVLHCYYIFSESETIFNRDNDRNETDKTVGRDVVQRFMINQELPTLNENFQTVEIIIN